MIYTRTGKIMRMIGLYGIWILVTLLTLFPIYWLFLVSIRTRTELFSDRSLIPSGFFLENYTAPFLEGTFGRYLVNSLVIATSNTVLVVVLAVLATYALSRYAVKGKDNIFFWTITNRMAPPAAFMLPTFLLYSRVFRVGAYRLFDTHLGLILAYCLFNLPFAIWLLKGIMDGISIDLDEAAHVDGANVIQIVWRIIVPLAAPGIAVTALMSWLFSWNEYLLASTLTSVEARTITTGLSEFVTVVGTNWGQMAAVAVVCLLPGLLLLFFVQRYIVAGLTFGAVKG